MSERIKINVSADGSVMFYGKDADHVIKYVNNHDDLVETLERMTAFMALHTGDGCQGNEGVIANRWSEPDPERAMAVFEKDVNDARAVLKNAK